MVLHSLLVKSVDLRHIGGSAGGDDVLGNNFYGCQGAPSEKKLGPLSRKGACDGSADRPAGSIDHRNLVLQQHHRFLSVLSRRSCRHRDVGKWAATNRPVRPSHGVCRDGVVYRGGVHRGWKCDNVREVGDVTVGVVTADLISRARAGDGDAFREVTEPHRQELRVHCYRMLGSFQDAEDALQDTLLNAWQGLGGFEGRASIRTWLYRIATNRCLSALRSASRRPAKEWDIPGIEPPEPTRLGEVAWLEPYPDDLLED